MKMFWKCLDRLMRNLDEFRVERSKRNFKHCGQKVFISPKAVIWPESGLNIGDQCQIHSFTHVFAGGGVTIGDYTMISSCCSIASVTHPIASLRRLKASQIEKPIIIGRNVWIGTAAIILPGVIIGDNSVIGAGTVVTHNVPPNCVVVGNPARKLREIVGLENI